MSSPHEATLDAVARILSRCRSVLFITGAGISADSGLPTYRGIGGLYDVETTAEGLPIEEILSGPMFHANPELTWKYLAQIAEAARGATFNRGHQVIAALEQRIPRVWTLTQNVDGFHRAAGSRNVIEIHGNMHSLSCLGCRSRLTVHDPSDWELPPRCRQCQAILRPNVVLFGELLPETALETLRRELAVGFEAIFSIGTSGAFPYIQEPVVQARRRGIPTVEINLDETVLSYRVDYRLPLGAAAALEALWERLSAA